MSTRPIVLVHGFWVTPRSWEHWKAHYEAKGHRVIAPAYPGFEVEVEALNADPSPIVDVTVPQIIAHLEEEIRALPEAPVIIGHSAGGAFTQILLDHGFGVAGAALNSAPTEGVRVVPLSQLKSTFPVLKSPANRHNRAPLLFVSGSEDHIMPPAIQESNAKHYQAPNTLTERREYEGYAHLLPAQKGWEQIADEVLDWALRHAR